MKVKEIFKRIAMGLIMLGFVTVAAAERIPDTPFAIMPLNGQYSGSAGSITEAQALAQLMDLKAQVGENNGNFRVGFNGIFGGEATLDRNCRLARDNNMSHAVIINVQTHAGPSSIQNVAAADFRNYQWRRDGVTWEGDDPSDDRDWHVVTPSRYATTLRTKFKELTDAKSKPIKRVMDDYPGIIISVNACIEEELATRGQATPYLADYSPFAITEFRDWLRHTGMYDADTGTYPTEGAPAAIVGSFVTINGKLRSPFYDDPTPADANGTGTSFNTKFGTSFSTWTLLNWDLTAYPSPITNPAFDPTPSSGTGYTAGGFDAPRIISYGNSFWKAWSWDFYDQGDTFPPGNPSAPAYGFRQTMIRNFVNDVLLWIEEEGIPAELITAHQIPAEMLFSEARSRSSASPVWSGLSKYNGTVGITRYGTINTTQMQYITQYTDDWGIYEWHPKQGETDETVLKSRTMQELEIIYDNNCRIVCPFTWNGGVRHPEYPVANSGVAEGLKEWLAVKVAEQVDPEPTSGLVAHWPLDEGSGTVTTNTAGSSYTATLENGVSWGSDAERGTYAVFDGTDDRIATTFTYALADTNDFTWAWWAKQLDTETGSIMVGSRYGNTGSESLEFIKFMRAKAAFANTGDAANIENYDYADLPSNEWHHYAMVKSGTNYQWYVDGVAQGSPVTINYSETTPIPFRIGGDIDGKPNECFNGCIDDVVLYRQALTPEDVVNVKDGFYPYVPLDYGLVAGWEQWASGSSPTTMQTNGIVGTATTSDFGTSKWGASTDGTFGTLASPAASALSDVHEEGLRKNGAVDVSIDFTLENTTAYDMELEKFYFDALLKTANTGPKRWNLQVLSGPITTGQVVDEALDYSTTGSDLADYAVDLTTLADHTLNAGSTVVFRLSFTGGDAANTSNTDVDNVAITGAFYDFPSINTPPTISDIIDQAVLANESTDALAFTVSDAGTPAAGLTLSKTSSDTTLVPEANIVFGGSGSNRTVTVTPSPEQSGSAVISIIAGDGSLSATNTFTLTVLPPGTVISTLYADFADSSPRQVDGSGPSILGGDASNATLFAGRSGAGGTVDRCIVFPFQLPALGTKTNPFTSASFSFNLVSNDFAPTNCNLDLYGLSSRPLATVLASDYNSETDVADPTPGTTRLQNNLCTPATAAGNTTNSPAGGTALIDYLNAQYAGGTNAGRWVFLRLSKDALVGTSTKKYTVMAANGASTNNGGLPDYTLWPRIQFTAVAATPTNPAVVMPTLSNEKIELAISGDPAFNYTVQASTNLVDWVHLLTTNSPALPFNWTDTNAGSFSNRFYRVLVGP